MTMKLPQKAGFVATPDEWDALVRIAENLAAQVVQRDAALREMQAERDAALRDLIHVAEQWHASEKALDAARAEVALVTDGLMKVVSEYHRNFDGKSHYMVEAARAALRQPAPAPAQDNDPPLIRWQHEADAERNEPAQAGGEARP